MEREVRSLINKYFTKENYIDLIKIIKTPRANNNQKGILIKRYLRDNNIPFKPLGTGTNRLGILIEDFAVKIALDSDGMIDNRREMLYSKILQPYVVKVYECIPSGLIAVTEYVTYFNMDDYVSHKSEMEEILEDIAKNFLIGDCGITSKNYANWGIRRSDSSICILDFAYIYNVKFNVFSCRKCEKDGLNTLLEYDDNFVNLVCPVCGTEYEFGDLRRKITSKAQEEEIGDIRRLSYNVKSDNDILEVIPEFEPPQPEKEKKGKSKKLSKEELILKEYKQNASSREERLDSYWET